MAGVIKDEPLRPYETKRKIMTDKAWISRTWGRNWIDGKNTSKQYIDKVKV